jgi:hypothetical protein
MRERAKSGKSQTYPDTRTYSHILGILRKDKKVRYSRKIFDVIQMMEDEENERHVLLFDNIGKIDVDAIYLLYYRLLIVY